MKRPSVQGALLHVDTQLNNLQSASDAEVFEMAAMQLRILTEKLGEDAEKGWKVMSIDKLKEYHEKCKGAISVIEGDNFTTPRGAAEDRGNLLKSLKESEEKIKEAIAQKEAEAAKQNEFM